MNTEAYIITYDLVNNTDYEPLYNAIKSYGTWGKITESTWVIVTNRPASMIRDHLLQFLKPTDRILVVKTAHVAAWHDTLASNEWVKANLCDINLSKVIYSERRIFYA